MNWLPMNLPALLLSLLACASSPEDTGPCPTWYADVDGDGYGSDDDAVASCEPLVGRSLEAGDCDDRDPHTHPDAPDPSADGVDADCDGLDGCEGAVSVLAEDLTTCDGQLFDVVGDLIHPPAGDCVCSVSGTLTLIDAADAAELDRLESVGGHLEVDLLSERLSLPLLTQIDVRLLVALPDGSLELPRLQSVPSVDLEGVSEVELGALRECLSFTLHDSSVVSLELPELDRLSTLSIEHNSALQRVVMAPDARVSILTVESNGALAPLPFPQGVQTGSLYWTGGGERSELSVGALGSLSLGGHGELALPGLASYPHTLRIDGSLSVSLPDLSSVEALDLRYGALDAPELVQVGAIELTSATLSAPLLTQTSEVIRSDANSHLDLPRLEGIHTLVSLGSADLSSLREVTYLTSGPGTLPALVQVYSLYGEGAYPKLVSAHQLFGTPSAPALTQVTWGTFTAAPGHLDGLRSIDGSVYLEDQAVLPGLRSAWALHLVDVTDFQVPESASIGFLVLSGQTATPLPDPLPWPLRFDNFAPSAPFALGEIDGGVHLHDGKQHQAPQLSLGTIHGNLELNATLWTSLTELSVGRVEGDLRHCLPAVPTAELEAWLDTVEIHGASEDTCED
ncbi:MAG: hypothetical protein VX899_02225 [Myxococcota bacterium]|nr:hypothetical protein [Myxococcota bacterium]